MRKKNNKKQGQNFFNNINYYDNFYENQSKFLIE